MHFAKASAITALSSFVLISATPVYEKQQADVACHTSNSSPAIEDVTGVVSQLYNRGGDCAAGSPGELPKQTMLLILYSLLGLYMHIAIYVSIVYRKIR